MSKSKPSKSNNAKVTFRHRSAVTGQTVTEQFAKSNPKTTVKETVRRK